MQYSITYQNLNESLSICELNGDSGDFSEENPFYFTNGLNLNLYNVDVIGGTGIYTNRQNILTSTLVFNDDIQLEKTLLDTSISHSLDSYFDISFYNNNELVELVQDRDSENTPSYIEDIIVFDTIQLNVYFDYVDYTNRKTISVVGLNGYSSGYDVGYNTGYDVGYNQGYNTGYNTGYNVGINTNPTNNLSSAFVEVANTPVNIFKQIFDVDILGFNLASACFGIIGILLITWLIKKFLIGGD